MLKCGVGRIDLGRKEIHMELENPERGIEQDRGKREVREEESLKRKRKVRERWKEERGETITQWFPG